MILLLAITRKRQFKLWILIICDFVFSIGLIEFVLENFPKSFPKFTTSSKQIKKYIKIQNFHKSSKQHLKFLEKTQSFPKS